jgi:hypothetical protein
MLMGTVKKPTILPFTQNHCLIISSNYGNRTSILQSDDLSLHLLVLDWRVIGRPAEDICCRMAGFWSEACVLLIDLRDFICLILAISRDFLFGLSVAQMGTLCLLLEHGHYSLHSTFVPLDKTLRLEKPLANVLLLAVENLAHVRFDPLLRFMPLTGVSWYW